MADETLPFEILDVLGEGAFGAVCVARMREDPLRRLVAIKVLKPSYANNPKVLHRFRDEARLLSRLQHPHIVRVEQLVQEAARPFVIMELVRGLDARTVLRKQPRGLPAYVAMEIIRRTCIALHAAWHEASTQDGAPLRVIHRDIKPSNLLLSVHGQLKVADFGIATGQFDDREAMTDSLVMGSRAYMAPERLDGSRDTPAVDVYSAGMTLFEMLTGRVMGLSVNPGTHDRTLARQLERLTVEGMSQDHLSDLHRLLHRMCAYDPELRPSALVCATELERLQIGMPDSARTTLEEFANDVVQPMYEDRKRVPLRKAIAALEDSELLDAAAQTAIERPPPPPTPEMHKRPALFLGTLLGATLTLSVLAAEKAWTLANTERSMEGPTADQVRVRFWFPSEATARVGALALSFPGLMTLPMGEHELDLTFEDGRTVVCLFEARQGAAVRYVVDQGQDAISVDDADAIPCRRMGDPEPSDSDPADSDPSRSEAPEAPEVP